METTRQEKIASLLQEELGDIFLLYARENLRGTLLSVTNVRITPDLSQARVFLSIFPNEQATNHLALIERDTKMIRYELGKRLRHQLRIIPELLFHVDDSLDYLERINTLLKE